MAEKILIEEYKSQAIYYNQDTDKFECEIVVEDKTKGTKRQSLKDVRNEVDQFIKANLEFKPFKALVKDSWGEEAYVREFTGIRKDGSFTVKLKNSDRVEFFEQKDLVRVMQYNSEYVSGMISENEKHDARCKEHKEAKHKLAKLLKPMDLSKYKI